MKVHHNVPLALLAGSLGLVLSACGGGGGGTRPDPPPAPAPVPPPAPPSPPPASYPQPDFDAHLALTGAQAARAAGMGAIAAAWGYLGDDLPDLPVIRRVGLGIAVASADGFVRQHAHGVTAARGGEGAAREFCELIMRAQGTLEAAQAAYL